MLLRSPVFVALALAVALSACGGLPTTLVRRDDGCPSTAPSSGHGLEVYLSVRGADGAHALCAGQTLHDGEALEVEVVLNQRAQVQLIFVDPSGNAGALEARQSEAQRAVFLAPSGLLTQHAGEAQLFLAASIEPLEEADPSLHMLFEAIRETGLRVDPEGHVHPAGPSHHRSKPLHFDTRAELNADFDERGVAVLGLALRAGR